MALSDFSEKIGKVITTTVTLSEDVKRAEANIKDFQQQLRDSAKALDSYNSKIEALNEVKATYESIRDKMASLEAEVRQLKAMHEAEYKAHAYELKLARFELRDELKAQLEAQMDERFRKLEANLSVYANLMNSIATLGRGVGVGQAGEVLSALDNNTRQLPPRSED